MLGEGHMRKISWDKLLLSVAIPLAVGALSAFLSGGMGNLSMLEKPPLYPPAWLFPVAWTVLYIIMGIASYMISESGFGPSERAAQRSYAVSLLFNFFWSIIFFRLSAYLFAFLWLLGLWFAVLITLVRFYYIRKTAGLLFLPYLLWVTFAGYLNLSIYFLN